MEPPSQIPLTPPQEEEVETQAERLGMLLLVTDQLLLPKLEVELHDFKEEIGSTTTSGTCLLDNLNLAKIS